MVILYGGTWHNADFIILPYSQSLYSFWKNSSFTSIFDITTREWRRSRTHRFRWEFWEFQVGLFAAHFLLMKDVDSVIQACLSWNGISIFCLVNLIRMRPRWTDCKYFYNAIMISSAAQVILYINLDMNFVNFQRIQPLKNSVINILSNL